MARVVPQSCRKASEHAEDPCSGAAPKPHWILGSSPVESLIVAARGMACHAEGRGFESLHPLEQITRAGGFAYHDSLRYAAPASETASEVLADSYR